MCTLYQIKIVPCFTRALQVNLYSRTYEHKIGEGSKFAKKYNCTDLLYFETFPDIESAIKKEKQIKKWKREYKENVINERNPDWVDLYETISEYN